MCKNVLQIHLGFCCSFRNKYPKAVGYIPVWDFLRSLVTSPPISPPISDGTCMQDYGTRNTVVCVNNGMTTLASMKELASC